MTAFCTSHGFAAGSNKAIFDYLRIVAGLPRCLKNESRVANVYGWQQDHWDASKTRVVSPTLGLQHDRSDVPEAVVKSEMLGSRKGR